MTASALTAVSEPDLPGEETTDPPARFKLSWLASTLAVLAGVAAVAWHATRYGHWIVDDAAITFSYSRSVAEGLGPVLAPGQPPVEGFSDPTWMILLALGKVAGLFDKGLLFGIPDYVLFPKLLGLFFAAGILVLCHLVARQVFRRHAWAITLATGLGLAAIPSFVIWVVSGLENSLFAFFTTALAALLFTALRKENPLSFKVAIVAGVLVAAAALTRPEGLIYASAYPIVLLFGVKREGFWRSFRSALVSIAAFGVLFGGYVVWRYTEFHRLLANPSVAKKQGLPTFGSIIRPHQLVEYAGVALTLVVVAVVVWALVKAPWRRPLIGLVTPLALGVIAYGVMVPDWMAQYRFATPVWVLGTLCGVMAFAELLRSLPKVQWRAVAALVLAAASVPSAIGFVQQSDEFIKNPTVPACLIADRFGRGFNTYADMLGLQHASLLLPDLGGSSMTSRLELVDMAGLVNAPIADLTHKEDIEGLRNYVFDTVKPTFIHSWGPWADGNEISIDPRIDRDYLPILIYPGPGKRQGDFVRKDAVTDPAKLAAVQHYAQVTMMNVEAQRFGDGLDDCGPTLSRGSTIAPRG
ncbi:hypothetical protein [Amycolatopsis echigonensis]|uniref:Dolichyl-phosphate-mannose-protein mannosyltransferase n=1 Tax=Amycolatopsis echigonensis TaxID=2576905 RepID=A0A2N3WCS0_9PSEU|nr:MULTISPECIES: hypothetical protein [Amycolatopsis]MBB2501100.1 hypothetical protein [Amycolatopsis echigonensis]PKV91671.1 hypothetical protein ATK30_2456 [Amycolatopsis niigatensis]